MFLLLNKYLTTYTNSPSLPASLPLSVSTSVDNMLPTRISLLQVPPTAAGRQSAGSNNVLMCATFRLTHWLTHWLTHSRSCQPVAGSDWLTDNWTDQETESDTGTVCVGKGQTAAAAAAKLVFWQMFYNELSLLYKLVVICSWLTDWQTDWLIDWLMAALIAWQVNTIHTHTQKFCQFHNKNSCQLLSKSELQSFHKSDNFCILQYAETEMKMKFDYVLLDKLNCKLKLFFGPDRKSQSNRVRRSFSIRLATFSPTTTGGEVTSCDPTPTKRERERVRPKRAQHVHTAAVRPIKGKNRKKKKIQNKQETEKAKYVAFYTLGRAFIVLAMGFYNFYSNCSHCPLSIAPESQCLEAASRWTCSSTHVAHALICFVTFHYNNRAGLPRPTIDCLCSSSYSRTHTEKLSFSLSLSSLGFSLLVFIYYKWH